MDLTKNVGGAKGCLLSKITKVGGAIAQEPLKLPGRMTRSKNFKTPFFSRYLKFLSWGSRYGSRTSPKIFLKKYRNKYGC